MTFVDEARLVVRAGDGGGGAASFHRTKLQPRGGPDGGDGGRGGSIIFRADAGIASLSTLVGKRNYRADAGTNGGPNNRSGRDADDVVLRVPVGTVLRDVATGELLADLAKHGVSYTVARGGRGGRGNAALKSSADRIPNYAERGESGTELQIQLEVRLVADIGLIGAPNAGKSTLLKAISGANPKIADYPFTTLEPGLGVVDIGDERLIAADLPGLIEGASQGKGIGLRFLRHATRCRVLAAVVDLASGDPVGVLESVTHEVETYDADLGRRVTLIVGNKIDLDEANEGLVREWAAGRGAEFVAVSAQFGTGLDRLRRIAGDLVSRSRDTTPDPESFAVLRPVREDRIVIEREGSGFRVTSDRVERLLQQWPVANRRATRRLQRRLRSMGVDRALAQHGAREGDDIFIGESTFEFHPEEFGVGGTPDA